MAKRGELTATIRATMESFLGRETSVRELRLYPYLLTRMVNERTIDPIHVNAEERVILSLLRAAGHIEGGACGLRMTKEFWDFAQGVVWLAYAAYDDAMLAAREKEGGV